MLYMCPQVGGAGISWPRSHVSSSIPTHMQHADTCAACRQIYIAATVCTSPPPRPDIRHADAAKTKRYIYTRTYMSQGLGPTWDKPALFMYVCV